MKTRTYLSTLALLAAGLLSGCSDSNDVTPNTNPYFPEDGVMRFATTVTDAQTRSGYDDSNVTGQDLRLWATPQGYNAKEAYTYKCIFLHYADGGWGTYSSLDSDGSYTSTTLLWQDKTTPVEVMASNFGGSPMGGDDLQTEAPISVRPQQYWDSHMKNSDYLYFRGSVNPALTADKTASDGSISQYALSGGKVRLPLRHINSKLNLTLTLGTEFNATADGLGMGTDNPLTDVKVNNVYCDRLLDMTTGTFGAFKDYEGNEVTPGSVILTLSNTSASSTWAPATAATKNAVATYECILIPQEATFSVSFTLGGKEYQWTSTNAVTFESGKVHTLKLTVGKDLTVSQANDISANEWNTTTPAGSIETE